MGIVSTTLSQSNNMKFLLVLAVAAYARAEAEAKPGFVYTTGLHHPLVYGGYPYVHHAPVVYAAAPVGCQNNEGAAVPCAHGVFPYGLVPAVAPAAAEEEAVESVEKREAEPTAEADAEADPEADPWLYYHGLGYAARPYGYGYYGLGYGHHLGYAGYYGHHLGYYGKRSAEAEPTAEADAEASPEADPWLYYTHTVMVIMAMVWATLPMLDITPTLTSEAAETTTEPWFPVPGNSVEVSALVLK